MLLFVEMLPDEFNRKAVTSKTKIEAPGECDR